MSMNKVLLIAIMLMAGLSALLTILQVWGVGLGWEIYIKLMITFGVLGLLCAFVMVLKSDLGEHTKLKDGNYLD